MSSGLERRYRRVLRLVPGWYRERWEQDMVSAFLDSWLTGDPEADEAIIEFCKPTWPELASVAGLAVRLHLGGPGTPRRYAWGQAIRRAVLAVLLVHAVLAVDVLVFLVRGRRLVGWLPAPPGSLVIAPGGVWVRVFYLVCIAWIAIFVALALGHYRTARVLAALAIVPGLVALLQDYSGLCCILVSLACLAHAPRAWSRQAAGTGLWSLTLALLAAVAGAYRILSLTGYLNDPHLTAVSLAELLIVLAAVALVAPDAARAQAATPAPPPYPRAMAA